MADSLTINLLPIERYWFLTWTTYSSWLLGDDRGYVGWTTNEQGELVPNNAPNSPLALPNATLKASAQKSLKSSPVTLNREQADSLFQQFGQTCDFRKWLLLAAAIMTTHLHLLVGVSDDPDPDKILGDLKAHGTRRLNSDWGSRPSGTWWTTGGSTRKLKDRLSIPAVGHYIQNQPSPLLVWTRDEGRIV